LTCSDFDAILSYHLDKKTNPFGNAGKVFRLKTFQEAPAGKNPFTSHGNDTEKTGKYYDGLMLLAGTEYELQTGDVLLEVGVYINPKYPFLGGSADGIAIHSGKLIEIKCPLVREITNEFPHHYKYQVQGLLNILELDEADFVQFKPAGLTEGSEKQVLFINRKTDIR
jgi:hypothetical protein